MLSPDQTASIFPFIQSDIDNGPEKATSAMAVLTAMLYVRYQDSRTPIALVSMDNCSHNGDLLRHSVLTMAREWQKKGYVTEDFLAWLGDETQVSFPWTMIDKITPRAKRRDRSRSGVARRRGYGSGHHLKAYLHRTVYQRRAAAVPRYRGSFSERSSGAGKGLWRLSGRSCDRQSLGAYEGHCLPESGSFRDPVRSVSYSARSSMQKCSIRTRI